MTDKLIEAMAHELAELVKRNGIVPTYKDYATAAYNALRAELVPMGWQYDRTARSPHLGTDTRTSGYQWPDWMQDGYTETKLYALPEIKP